MSLGARETRYQAALVSPVGPDVRLIDPPGETNAPVVRARILPARNHQKIMAVHNAGAPPSALIDLEVGAKSRDAI